MCECVHPHLVVGCVHSHGLLTHCTLIAVTRRLVVVWERDDGGADAEDHRRVDFEMRVLVVVVLPVGVDVANEHGNHSRLFFLDIEQLDQSVFEELLEVPLAGHDLANMLLAHFDLIVVHDEHGTLHATAVRVDLNLFLVNVSDN